MTSQAVMFSKSLLLLLVLVLPLFSVNATHSHKEIHVDVDKICKALWDSGFKLMSLVLEKQLPHLLHTCHNIHNSHGITILAPSDKYVYDFPMKRDRNRISLHNQIMTSKFDRHTAFELGSFRLATCNQSLEFTVYAYEDSWGFFRSNVQRHSVITHWDIYNDSSVTVHGVDNFFRASQWWDVDNVIPIRPWLPKKNFSDYA